MIIKLFAAIAVMVLLVFLVTLRVLLGNFHKVSGSFAKRGEEGFLPYPLQAVEGDTRSKKAAARYNSVARVGMGVMVVLVMIPVLFAMVRYFQR
ncbi:MAG: hypothetical protein CSA95_08950 [Bacteroidetes bacterium]|nr:MAG: hypothetical protein CSA95_08950 [Bacteroidota bacterium]PIE88129.1 MAG: hypothetical protein CSA04_03465 [Bacteroidota bacterium]